MTNYQNGSRALTAEHQKIKDRACMAGHAQAAFNHLDTLEPIKNVRSVDKIF